MTRDRRPVGVVQPRGVAYLDEEIKAKTADLTRYQSTLLQSQVEEELAGRRYRQPGGPPGADGADDRDRKPRPGSSRPAALRPSRAPSRLARRRSLSS